MGDGRRTDGDMRSTLAPVHEDEPVKPGLLANTAALVVGRLVIAVLGWSGTVLIARDLSTEAFGQFTLVFSLLGMLSIVTDLGVGRIVIGGLVGDAPDRDRLAGTYILLRTTLGLLGYALALAVVTLADYPDPVPKATAVAGLIVVLATPSSAYDAAFQVTGRLARIAVADTLGQLAQIALTVALVVRGSSLVWYTVPGVLNAALVMLWKVPASHRLIPFRYRVDLRLWWVMLKEAVPLSAGAAFATLYYRVDSIMLASIADFEAVGLYGVAYKFVDLVHFIPGSLTVAILAPLAAAWPERTDEFLGHIRSGAMLLAVIGGGVVVGVWLFAEPAVSLLYGSEFAPAGLATSLAVSGEVLAFGSALLIAVMISVGRQKAYPLITLAGLGVNIAANAVLIPRFSIEGAAAATLGTESLVLAILLWWAHREGDLLPSGLGSLGRLPVVMAGSIAVGLGLSATLPWLVAAVLTGALYLVAVDRSGATGQQGLRGLIEGRAS
ncbi:MAG: flippase [Acidimicrobiales bacterium]